ncbi:Death-inducer obliterator 1, partial [Frankliniella fusca]
ARTGERACLGVAGLQPSRECTFARGAGGGGSVPSRAWTGARAGGASSASSVPSPMTRPAGVDRLDGGAAGAVRVDPAVRDPDLRGVGAVHVDCRDKNEQHGVRTSRR